MRRPRAPNFSTGARAPPWPCTPPPPTPPRSATGTPACCSPDRRRTTNVNHDAEPRPPGPSWLQVFVQFDDYTAAEHTGVTHLRSVMTDAEEAGLVASWWFVRKAPCWRLRYLPAHHAEQDAQAFLRQMLDALRATGRIAGWVETIYEPEVNAFGGPAAMDVAHRLFHQDSRHILNYLGSDHAATTGEGDKRRELSILLCTTLMRGARQDWYEQGDIWARLAENRPLPPEMALDRVSGIDSGLRRLMTVDAGPVSTLVTQGGPLTYLADWAAAFDSAGTALGDLARDGTLRRGVRAILTHHVIFHWNRIGLPYETQSILAHAAKAAVLGS
ncbi:MAG: methyltransferase [Pseudonocardiaceae bacterium]|nr:methyltransferase [Pseudonocardiaceae bacterium]